jgi:hypothetical protein
VKRHRTATSSRTSAPTIQAPALAPQGRPVSGSGSEGGWTPLQQAMAERSRRIGAGRQGVGSMHPLPGFPHPLYANATSGRRRARCLVPTPPALPRQRQGARGPPARLCGHKFGKRRRIPWAPRADRDSRIGSGTTTVTASAPMTPTMPQHACNMETVAAALHLPKGARHTNAEWTPVRW